MKRGIASSNDHLTIIDSKSTDVWYTQSRFEDTLYYLLIEGLLVAVWHLSEYLSAPICECTLRVEQDENIADLSLYNKYQQISSCIRL